MLEIQEVAQAVVDVLNAAQLSEPFEAAFAYVPTFDLHDMEDLHVTVAPHDEQRDTADRSTIHRAFSIDVGIQQKVAIENGRPNSLAMTRLMRLAGEIVNLFGPGAHDTLATHPTAYWTETTRLVLYDPSHLLELNQFTSVVRFTFEVWELQQ